jgi:hypothetical protein
MVSQSSAEARRPFWQRRLGTQRGGGMKRFLRCALVVALSAPAAAQLQQARPEDVAKLCAASIAAADSTTRATQNMRQLGDAFSRQIGIQTDALSFLSGEPREALLKHQQATRTLIEALKDYSSSGEALASHLRQCRMAGAPTPRP